MNALAYPLRFIGFKDPRGQGAKWHKVKRQRSKIEGFNSKNQELENYEATNISDLKRADNLLDPKYKPLNPWPLGPLNPYLQLFWRRTVVYNSLDVLLTTKYTPIQERGARILLGRIGPLLTCDSVVI